MLMRAPRAHEWFLTGTVLRLHLSADYEMRSRYCTSRYKRHLCLVRSRKSDRQLLFSCMGYWYIRVHPAEVPVL